MIRTCALPTQALLRKYSAAGSYTDCYVANVAREVSQAQFIEAFYSTRVFKLERLLLAWFAGKPSTDAQVRALAEGKTDSFAAWHVEGRTTDQLLLSDFRGRTRSWLMSESGGDATGTRLYFGSAVVAIENPRSGRREMGLAFRALLGFHKIYSRVLLRAALSRLTEDVSPWTS